MTDEIVHVEDDLDELEVKVSTTPRRIPSKVISSPREGESKHNKFLDRLKENKVKKTRTIIISDTGSAINQRNRVVGAVTTQYRREKNMSSMTNIHSPRDRKFVRNPTRTENIRGSFDTHLDIGEFEETHDTKVVAKLDGVDITQSDVQLLVDEEIEDLKNRLMESSKYIYYKSLFFKTIGNVVYLIIQLVAAAISILGLLNGSSVSSLNDHVSTGDAFGNLSAYFFIIGVLGAVNIVLVEINSRYKFDERSGKFLSYSQSLDMLILELKEMPFNPMDPRDKLSKIKYYELEMDMIELNAFNSQIITNKEHKTTHVKHTDNIKPDDIPVDV